LAIFAPNAITAMVKATERSGGLPVEHRRKRLALGQRRERFGYPRPE